MLIGIALAVMAGGGFVGWFESLVGREVLDALAPTISAQLKSAAATPGAEDAPGLLQLLWAEDTALAFRGIIWWVAGMVQVSALLVGLKTL